MSEGQGGWHQVLILLISLLQNQMLPDLSVSSLLAAIKKGSV